MNRVLGLDVETRVFPYAHPWVADSQLVAVGLADELGWKKTWLFFHNLHTSLQSQREMIEEIQAEIDKADMLVGHNIKFDLNWMRYIGIEFDRCRIWCTQVTEFLLRGQRMGELKLSDLSKQYLTIDKKDKVATFWDAGWDTEDIPTNVLLPYLEQDCINALAIYQRQKVRIQEEGMGRINLVQCEMIKSLSEMECNGLMFDYKIAEMHEEDLRAKLRVIDVELKLAFGFDCNMNSGDELSVALFGGLLKVEGEEWIVKEFKHHSTYKPYNVVREVPMEGLGFKPPKGSELKKKGYYSTDKTVLKQLKGKRKVQKEVVELMAKRSGLNQAVKSLAGDGKNGKGLINKVQPDGCIHPSLNQTIAKTGRLTSSNPNGQNLPRKGTSPLKQCIIPRFDGILNVDLAQLEWRVCAFLCQDPTMIHEILNGVDQHADNAIKFFDAKLGTPDFDGKRTTAKIMTFRLIYGGTAYGFYMDSKMPSYSRKRWMEIVEAFYKKYPMLQKWQAQCKRIVYRDGGTLRNPTGRKFIFHKHTTGKKEGQYKEQQIKNFPVQSLATADIMPLAMVVIYKLYKARKFKSLMLLQVHDSLVFDVKREEVQELTEMCIQVFDDLPKYIKQVFGFEFNIPLTGDAEAGPNYGDQKKYKP